MSTSPAAPPPFSRQRGRSWLLLAGLAAVLGAVVSAGALITVPTYITTRAVVEGASRCAELGVPPGEAGCVVVRLDRSCLAPPGTQTSAQLTPPDGVPVTIAVRSVGGPMVAGPLRSPVRSPVPATVQVGRRPLALVFLGRGLGAP